MRKNIKWIVAAALLSSSAQFVFARSEATSAPAPSSPMYERLKKPCAKDLKKSCSGMTGFEAIACLDKNKASLLPSCRDAMTPKILQKARADKAAGVANPCAPVFAKVCPDAEPGVALYKCLKAHDSQLPQQCRVTGKAGH